MDHLPGHHNLTSSYDENIQGGSNVLPDTPSLETSYNNQSKFQVFSYASSLHSCRSLHKKNTKMEHGFFKMYEMMDQLPEHHDLTRSNEEDMISLQSGFSHSENILHKTQGLGTTYNESSELQVFSCASSLHPRRSLHKTTIRSIRRSFHDISGVSWSNVSGIGRAFIRNHPSAPPCRYTSNMKRHYKHKILQRTYSHQGLKQGEYKQMGFATIEDTANSFGHDQLQFRDSTSGCMEPSIKYKGIPLRNVPTAPSPYITQIKHNEKTSRYIAQLAQKATNCQMKCWVDNDQNKEETARCLINENSDSSLETFLPLCRNDDRSPCASFGSSSPEHHYSFKTSCSKSTRAYFPQHSLNILNKDPVKDTISLPLEDSEKKDYLLSGPASSDNISDIMVKEEETNDRKTDSVKSLHDDPELPRYLTIQEDECVDLTPEKIVEYCKEEEDTGGLKLDISFSFVEKGGYHPIALPLGCHIYEDDSNSSDNEMEGVSVLEKRMTKMGRDEYNLNVDKSSSFMPWILIPLDDIPKVNYEKLNFHNPYDPRLDKLLKSDTRCSETNCPIPSSCEMQVPNECLQTDVLTGLADIEPIDYPTQSIVQNLNSQNFQEVPVSTCDILPRAIQGCEDSLLDIMDFSFSDSFLKENAESLKLSDKILDSLSEEKVAWELEQGLLQHDGCNQDRNPKDLLVSEGKKISDTPKINNSESISLMENFQADVKEMSLKKEFDTLEMNNEQNKTFSTSENREIIPVNEGSPSSSEIKQLPRSTMQLLKETYTFLKDQNLSKRGIRRRHRRVSTSLRVADYALPNFLEEFYMESESCNFAEQSGICCADTSPDKKFCTNQQSESTSIELNDFEDETKKEIEMPRRSKRRANMNKAKAVSRVDSKKSLCPSTQKDCEQVKQTLDKKDCNVQKVITESCGATFIKQSPIQKIRNKDLETKSAEVGDNPFIVQFAGKKYQCHQGVLTPIDHGKKIQDVSGSASKNIACCNKINSNHDQNASKTVHIGKMKNSVIKRPLENAYINNLHNSAKKVKHPHSPKVMVQNCLQAISASSTSKSSKKTSKSSKKVTTKESEKAKIIKKTATVKKELFPVLNKGKRCKTDRVKTSDVDVDRKGCKVVKQPSSSLKNVKNKRGDKNTANVLKPKLENAKVSPIRKGKKVSDLKGKCVKPIIRVHQGLCNTSLKKFKALQKRKLDPKSLIEKNVQKNYHCPHCERGFSKVSQLDKHIKEDHQCSKCDKMLDSKVSTIVIY